MSDHRGRRPATTALPGQGSALLAAAPPDPTGHAAPGAGLARPVAPCRLRSLTEFVEVADRLAGSTGHEVLEMVPSEAGVAEALRSCREVDLEILRRGVSYRLIVESSHDRVPELLSEIERRRAAGACVHVTEHCSSWFRLFDQVAAMVPHRSGPAPSNAVLVRERDVISDLHALFVRMWDRSSDTDPASAGRRVRDRQVLDCLNDGVTDEVAARRMDVSVRTYRRYVADVMGRLGASSRFQAGALAVGRGWLGDGTADLRAVVSG